MTVESSDDRAQYATNGLTGPFRVPFYFLANQELAVTHTDAQDVETLLELDVDFSVVGAGNTNGGTVTTTVGYPSGGRITILRDMVFSQESEYVDGDSFPAKTLERDLDRQTMIAQQQREQISRAILFPVSEQSITPLPSATQRANKLMSFDSAGDPVAIAPSEGSATALSLQLASTDGAAGVGLRQAGAGAIDQYVEAKVLQIVNAKDYGALPTNTLAQNRTAVQEGIAYLATIGGGVLVIDHDCPYGYKVRDVTTHPLAGVTADIVVRDSSVGASYTLPAKDGAQTREFYATAQSSNPVTFTAGLAASATSGTLSVAWNMASGPWLVTFSNGDKRVVTFANAATTATWVTGLSAIATASASYLNPGNNDGNTHWQRSDWAPFSVISNDSALAPAGDPSRTVTDNRRAHRGFALDGNIIFYDGIGTQAGATYTDGQMANYHMNRAMYSATAWTTATAYLRNQNVTFAGAYYVCLADHTSGTFATDLAAADWILTAFETTAHLIEYETGRMSWNRDSNGFLAAYHFKERTPGVVQMIVEGLGTRTFLVLRTAAGVAQDVDIRNNGGDLELLIDALGTAFSIRGANRRCVVGLSLAQQLFVVTYSASMTIDTTRGNVASITATNATGFAINAPTNASAVAGETQLLTITIRNTSGGALGAATWNAVFKMAAWVQPATGFSRSITFYFDGANWIETTRTAADIPN